MNTYLLLGNRRVRHKRSTIPFAAPYSVQAWPSAFNRSKSTATKLGQRGTCTAWLHSRVRSITPLTKLGACAVLPSRRQLKIYHTTQTKKEKKH